MELPHTHVCTSGGFLPSKILSNKSHDKSEDTKTVIIAIKIAVFKILFIFLFPFLSNKIKDAATEAAAPKNASSDCRQTNPFPNLIQIALKDEELHFYKFKSFNKDIKRYRYPIKDIYRFGNIRFVWQL